MLEGFHDKSENDDMPDVTGDIIILYFWSQVINQKIRRTSISTHEQYFMYEAAIHINKTYK